MHIHTEWVLGSSKRDAMESSSHSQEPKLENLLGRHSHFSYGEASTADHTTTIFPNSCLQVAAPGGTATTTSSATTNNASIGLSMIKSWLRNQPTPTPTTHNNNNNNNVQKKESASDGGNSTQTHSLSLSMSTGSQSRSSSPALPLLGAPTSSASTLTTPPPPVDALPRKSNDTFGQRTSIYRGVTRFNLITMLINYPSHSSFLIFCCCFAFV